jgi:DNA-binding MarR family transcriptional regulator
VHAAVVHAYSLALQPVFLTAVPLALVAFVLSLFLRDVPLRDVPLPDVPLPDVPLRATASASAADIGEGLGATGPGRSSVDEVERALAKLAGADIRRRGYERLAALAGLDLPAGSCWVLTRLARQGPIAGPLLAQQAGVSTEHGKPYVDRLVAAGLVVRSPVALELTPAGQAAADRLFAARRDGLRELLADWSPEQHAELADLLSKLSRAVLGNTADRGLIST